MRPVELTLDGFGSYKQPQTISFDGVSLGCITGHNGAGKSSMFQAMQFSMFGQVSNGDIDSIVNDDSTAAEVIFTFDHADSRYRITRTRSRGKKTSARLERETDGEFVVIEASGVRAVDQEMERLIRISPETFASTVLMAQEDSGRFAKASPAERKQILGEILGLDQYAELSKAARDKAREARHTYSATETAIAEIDEKLSGSDEDMAALMSAQTRLYELAPVIASTRNRLEQGIAALSTVTSATNRLAAVKQQITSMEAAAVRHRNEITSRLTNAKARVTRAESTLAEAKRRLDAVGIAEKTVSELVAGEQTAQANLALSEEAERKVLEGGADAKNQSESETTEIERLQKVLQEANERLALLQHDHDVAECFTCHQSLSSLLRDQLVSGVQNEINMVSDAISQAKERRGLADEKRSKLRNDLAFCRNSKDQAKKNFEGITRKLAEVRSFIASKETLAKDVDVAGLERDSALSELVSTESELEREVEDKGIASLRAEAESLKSETKAASSAAIEKEEADRILGELTREESALQLSVGRLSERIAGYETLRDGRDELVAKGARAAKDVEEWNLLVNAYGQDGVPNLVFAGAAQELERDAADLMSKLTGGRYRLEMKTEKVNKVGGDTISALDIAVMAESGQMRPFGRLSGGEKFRVALVLHTSLTRFLVRRSGAPIEFLAVDEGWGALDPEGIVAMLEALRTLHEEFPLILTITHTPEVASAFECRYEVEKDSDGTSVVTQVAA